MFQKKGDQVLGNAENKQNPVQVMADGLGSRTCVCTTRGGGRGKKRGFGRRRRKKATRPSGGGGNTRCFMVQRFNERKLEEGKAGIGEGGRTDRKIRIRPNEKKTPNFR